MACLMYLYGSRADRPGSHRCRLTSPANSWSPRMGPCPALQRLEGVHALPYRASASVASSIFRDKNRRRIGKWVGEGQEETAGPQGRGATREGMRGGGGQVAPVSAGECT
eukprot:SAG25_NODE_634_length_6297_cov_3.877541_5_plen_110_part_00